MRKSWMFIAEIIFLVLFISCSKKNEVMENKAVEADWFDQMLEKTSQREIPLNREEERNAGAKKIVSNVAADEKYSFEEDEELVKEFTGIYSNAQNEQIEIKDAGKGNLNIKGLNESEITVYVRALMSGNEITVEDGDVIGRSCYVEGRIFIDGDVLRYREYVIDNDDENKFRIEKEKIYRKR